VTSGEDAVAEHARMGIGALSRAVGIPADTLRTWERRYGFPVPDRTPSGHRRYRAADIPRLRRIAALLARGVRAGDALTAGDAEAELLLRASSLVDGAPVGIVSTLPPVDALLHAIRRLDARDLTRRLQAAWAALGPVEFAATCMAPLLTEVGDRWARGELEVRHEHFLTECVEDFLRTVRIPIAAETGGPVVALATLPGESHGLGLQLASLVLVANGLRTVNAGIQLPEDEIVSLATDAGAFAVGVSVSSASGGSGTARRLTRLRAKLPRRVRLLVGGTGAPSARRGIDVFDDLRVLATWARRLGGLGG